MKNITSGEEVEEQKATIKNQIATVQWVLTVAVLTEAALLSKLYVLNDNAEGEEKILLGIWVQTIGQLLEAVGVTQELKTTDKNSKLKAQKTAITGDAIQSLGAALQAVGGVEVLQSDGEDILIP